MNRPGFRPSSSGRDQERVMAELKVSGGKGSSQGPFCMWQGIGLPMWLKFRRMHPPMDRGNWLKIALTNAAAVNNSFLGTLENLFYAKRVREHQPKSPVFILGHWRSGTTLLHETLSSDPQFTTTSLYHVLAFHHFLLTEKVVTSLTGRFLPKTRPMDNMEVSWQAPQEDESILCNLTLLSPYLMLAFHGNTSVYERFFDLHELNSRELQQWKDALVLMLKKITLKNNLRPLLKSPTHSYRVRILLEMFPDAKFINIVRNPYAVFPSTVNLRKQMFRENGFANPDYSTIEEDVFHTYELLFRTMERDVPLIPKGQYVEVKYEDYEQDILGETKRIYDELQFDGWGQLEPIIQSQLAARKAYKKNKFKMEESLQRQIHDRLKFVFDKYGYPSDLPGDPAQVA